MLNTKFLGNWPGSSGDEDCFLSFDLTWTWRTSWSRELNQMYMSFFPLCLKSAYKK